MNGVRKHMEQLQRCPNCGGEPRLRSKKGSSWRFWYECFGDCWTQTDKYADEKDARAEWNSIKQRVTEPTAKSGYCPICDEVIEVYSGLSMCYCPVCGHHIALRED